MAKAKLSDQAISSIVVYFPSSALAQAALTRPDAHPRQPFSLHVAARGHTRRPPPPTMNQNVQPPTHPSVVHQSTLFPYPLSLPSISLPARMSECPKIAFKAACDTRFTLAPLNDHSRLICELRYGCGGGLVGHGSWGQEDTRSAGNFKFDLSLGYS